VLFVVYSKISQLDYSPSSFTSSMEVFSYSPHDDIVMNKRSETEGEDLFRSFILLHQLHHQNAF